MCIIFKATIKCASQTVICAGRLILISIHHVYCKVSEWIFPLRAVNVSIGPLCDTFYWYKNATFQSHIHTLRLQSAPLSSRCCNRVIHSTKYCQRILWSCRCEIEPTSTAQPELFIPFWKYTWLVFSRPSLHSDQLHSDQLIWFKEHTGCSKVGGGRGGVAGTN